MTGTVYNIQPYSLHDGPGIRTVVFLKGCPLRCRWCANPESQRPEPEAFFDAAKCIFEKGCRWCETVCPEQAIQNGTLDFERCTNCCRCQTVCPSKALSVFGKRMDVSQVLEAVEKEQAFYRHGQGGLTLSGGEPMMQAEFSIALLKEAKKRHIHTAMETCGFCQPEELIQAAQYLDYLLFDIKLMEEQKHIQNTGVSNRRILSNLELLFEVVPRLPKRIRTPVIPGVNDTAEEIAAIRAFLSRFDHYSYELLPYHRFGEGKYGKLGRRAPDLPLRLDQSVFQKLCAQQML